MRKIKIPWDFIKSTVIVLFISCLGALSFHLAGYSFFISFLLFFVFQYIIFSFLGNLINNFFIQKTKQKELDVLEPLSTILECAYCNTKNVMTFLPDQNERLQFECSSCKKTNSVNIQFVVARTTEPIQTQTPIKVDLKDEN